MTDFRAILLSAAASCSVLIATSAIAQTANKPASPASTLGTANTPSPLTTPGSMNDTTINPATGTPYVSQVNLTGGPISPTNTTIDPATGTPYVPQVNMNGPATNDPGVVGNGVSAPPSVITPAPPPNAPSGPATPPQN